MTYIVLLFSSTIVSIYLLDRSSSASFSFDGRIHFGSSDFHCQCFDGASDNAVTRFWNKLVYIDIATDVISNVISCGYDKGAVVDMRYFARSKFSWCLVHNKTFSLIWQVVFKLGYVFCQER